ncbi:hypothetical protein OIO90_002109 [Microbotryomycetes sp. JL221]|nr:hypothetical protein OIO90_002109 [Microbotryomycetes sp. JL221]
MATMPQLRQQPLLPSQANAGQIPDATMLIQDLLSPASVMLPSTTPALLSYHLSTHTLDDPSTNALVTMILRCIMTSPALWRGQAQSTAVERVAQWRPLNFARTQDVYTALVQAWLLRINSVKQAYGTGWSARRKLASFLEAYFEGVNHPAFDDEPVHPVIQLVASCACLAALQTLKLNKDDLYVGGSALMGRAHEQTLLHWRQFFYNVDEQNEDRNQQTLDSKDQQHAGARPSEWTGSAGDEVTEVPTWLAAQTLPIFPVLDLAQGPPMIQMLSIAFTRTFAAGHLFANLGSSITNTHDGLVWTVPSESHSLISSLSQSTTFRNLGPISRALGRLIEAAAIKARSSSSSSSGSANEEDNTAALLAMCTFITILSRVAARVNRDWRSTFWSDLTDDVQLAPATRQRTEPWTMLKSLLFSVTLIDSSLLALVTPRDAAVEPTALQLDLTADALTTLSKTYFITLRFGNDGFTAWKGVWSGLMDVAARGTTNSVGRLMGMLEPRRLGHRHDKLVERSEATFFLNAAEQLMTKIGDDYVEETVLKCCFPYLEDSQYRDTFESAHSVLLSVFATNKRCATDIAPWYSKLLLKACPSLMSASQLRLAYTTMVRCVSSCDDALAWYCIQQLIDAIEDIPVVASSLAETPTAPTSSVGTSTTEQKDTGLPPGSEPRDYDAEQNHPRLDEASNLSPLEQAAMRSDRGALLLTLIDQTTSVNLILLAKLLDKVWEFIKVESTVDGVGFTGDETSKKGKRTRPVSTKQAFVDILFQRLGEGLDATKRAHGIAYWLERRDEFAG